MDSTRIKSCLTRADMAHRVVIVGAGIAGLSAAEHLLKNRFEHVAIVEAKHRIGGRIHTVNFGKTAGDLVEMGANWIHGTALNNSVFTLANQHGLLDGSVFLDRMEGFCYKSNGEAIDRNLSEKVWNLFQQFNAELEWRFVPDKSVQNFVTSRFYEEVVKNIASQFQEDARAVFNCIMNFFRFTYGGFPEHIPCLPTSHIDLEIPGGNLKVPSGMNSIVDNLAAGIPAKKITLSDEVKTIRWRCEGQYSVEVITDKGRLYTADHVIVTASLGYLKKHHKTLFQPNLPERKVKAIENVCYGKVNKIFLYFDKPFWKLGTGSIKLAWRNEEANPKSAEEWYKKIFAFDEVLNNRNVLVAWISGPEAVAMELLTDEEVLTTCTKLLRQFLKNPAIPSPQRIRRSKWCTDPHTLGSYSYHGWETTEEDIGAIREPVTVDGVPRILFAGEATCPLYYSTMHGARSSGIEEAQRLLLQQKPMRTSKL